MRGWERTNPFLLNSHGKNSFDIPSFLPRERFNDKY